MSLTLYDNVHVRMVLSCGILSDASVIGRVVGCSIVDPNHHLLRYDQLILLTRRRRFFIDVDPGVILEIIVYCVIQHVYAFTAAVTVTATLE